MTTPVRILVVEDSADDAQLAVRALRRGGFAPEWERVQSAGAMRAALARGGWDAVIADYKMPGFTGLDALAVLQANGLDIPFIVVSGTIGEDLAVAAMKAGASDYVMKASLERLAPALERELKEAAQRTARRAAGRALRESEARFRALTAMSTDFYWETDAEHRFTGRVEGSRPSAVGEFRAGTQLGKRRWEVPYLSPDEAGWAAHRAMLDARLPFRDFEISRLGSDGKEHFISVSGEPMFDADGAFRGYRGVGTDITARKAADRAIREAHRQWIQTVDSMRDPLLVHDAKGRVVRANRAYAERAGMGFAELIGRPYWECFPRRDGPLPGCLAGHPRDPACKSEVTETEFALPDGKVFLSRAFPTALVGPEGGLDLHLLENITERRAAADRLRQSEEKFRGLVESTIDWIWEVDERCVYTYASPQVRALLGYEPAEVIGRTPFDFMPPEEAVRVGAIYDALSAARRPIASLENVNLSKDGRRVVLETSGRPIYDAAGAFRGYRGIDRDITERKRLQREVEQNEARLRALMEHASDLVALIDRAGIVRYASPSVRQLGGYEPAEVLGKPFTAFMHPEDAAAALQNLAALAAVPDGTHAAEFRYRCKDGHWIVLASMAKNALEDPAVRGIVLNARDVTEKRHFEQEIERQNRMLSVLSGIDALIVRVRDVEELYREACRIVVESGRLPLAWIAARDPAAEKLRMLAHAGEPAGFLDMPRPLRAGDDRPVSISVRALASGKPMLCNDIATHPEQIRYAAEALERGYHSVAAFPVLVAGKPVAVLTMLAREERFFDEAQRRLLGQLVDDIGFAIASLRSDSERREATEKLRASLEDTIGAIATTMEMRDPYTAGHQRRVADLGAAIATEMGLPEEAVRGVHFGALIHDLGKIQIPAELLAKPSKLSKLEFELIKTHPQAGYDIIKGIDFPWPVAAMVHQHHERLDGSGYPQGLKGEAIAPEARILAVADVVEAMSSHRPYRPGLGIDAALKEIEAKRGIWFDPRAVDACLRLFRDKGYAISQ